MGRFDGGLFAARHCHVKFRACSMPLCLPATESGRLPIIHSFLCFVLASGRFGDSDGVMDRGSIFGSLDRIEAALDRIEAVRLPPTPQIAPSSLDDLELRHTELKSSVAGALARLDALLDGNEA